MWIEHECGAGVYQMGAVTTYQAPPPTHFPGFTNPPILRFHELDAINPSEDDGDGGDLQF